MSLSRPYSIDGDPNIRNILNLREILLNQRQRSVYEFVFKKHLVSTLANPRLEEKNCQEVIIKYFEIL